MATINLGKVKVTPEGLYDSSKSYSELSLVGYEGSSYISIKDVPAGTLPTNTTYWQLHGSKGTDGTNGQNGADGADAINPFKGWYDTSATLGTAFPTPAVGDYAYVAGAASSDPVTIYRCTTAGTWSASSSTFNPANNQEFASGQSLNTVNIVDNLNSSSATDVLSAKQGKELKGQIDALGPKIDGMIKPNTKADFSISDERRRSIVNFVDGHIETKKFSSKKTPQIYESNCDLSIEDEQGKSIVLFKRGHIMTKNFDSSKINQQGTLARKRISILGDSISTFGIAGETGDGHTMIGDGTNTYQGNHCL